MDSSFIRKIWRFQSERFPIGFLLLTTAAYTETLHHINADQWMLGFDILPRVGLVVLGVFYLGHIRLFDEIRDENHDRLYYKQRPLPRGLVQARELRIIAFVLMMLELCIVAFINLSFLPHMAAVLLLTAIAGQDFLLGDQLRSRFFLYNAVMTIQSFLGLWVIMIIALGTMGLHSPSIIFLVFAYASMVFLEWIRKIRIPANENISRDTYSAQLGPVWAVIGGGVILVTMITLGLVILQQWVPALLWCILFAAYSYSASRYIRNLTQKSVRVYQGVCIAIFFSMYGVLWFYG